jgi:phage gp45-like
VQELKPGEVAIYSDEGDKVHLKRGRVIEVVTETLNITASSAVNIDTPLLTQTGKIVSQGDQIAGGVSQINHVHGGVMAGPGQTTAPVPGG